MRIEQTHIQRSKAFLHAAQALITFVAGCLALAILTKKGKTGGQVGFYFALCFLSIPALIYQVMVPMWTRAWRFANIYAYLVLDLLFALLWFSAFIALAVWQSQGIKKGASDDTKSSKSGCANFAYGSASRCNTSKASVGFGVVIFLLWALTSGISVYMLLHYRKTGDVPGKNPLNSMQQAPEDLSKDAWNPNVDDRSSDERRRYGQTSDEEDGQGLLPHTESPEPHPGRQLSYGSSTHSARQAPAYDDSAAPSALSPTGYEHAPEPYINPFANPAPLQPQHDQTGSGARVHFPQGPY